MFVLCAGYFNGRVIKYCKETDNYEIVYDGMSCARRERFKLVNEIC